MALPNPFTYWRRTPNTREYVPPICYTDTKLRLTPPQRLGLQIRAHRQTPHTRELQTSAAKLRRPWRTRAQSLERNLATSQPGLAQK